MRIVNTTLMALVLCTATFHADPGDLIKPVGSISGTSFKLIQIAMPKFEERGLLIEKYTISVLEEKESFFVLFEDPDRPQSMRGSSSKLPEYQVEISKNNLQVIRANYVR